MGWRRRLVARASPATAVRDFSQRIRRRKFFGADNPGATFRANRRRQLVPPPDAWPHEPHAGNAGFGPAIPSSAILGETSSFQTTTVLVGISK
jgi:hypothetical protein